MRAAAGVFSFFIFFCACGDLVVPLADTPTPREDQTLSDARCEDADADSPVKLFAVVDTSGSMQFTDQAGARLAALEELIAHGALGDNVEVATFGFGATVSIDPPRLSAGPLFIPAAEWTRPAFLDEAGVQGDQETVLGAVRDHLLTALLNGDEREIARTRYVVVLITDGAPSPVCCSDEDETFGTAVDPTGCAPEPFEQDPAPTARLCEAQEEQGLCNDAEFLDRFRENNPGALPGFVAGGDHNRLADIAALVEEMHEIADEFSVGELAIHVVALSPSTLSADVREIFRLNACRTEVFASTIADEGRLQVIVDNEIVLDPQLIAPLCREFGEATADCASFCAEHEQELIDNFGFTDDFCSSAAVVEAEGCTACEEVFADAGVLAEICQ